MNRRRFTAWLLISALITGVCACGKTEDTAPAWDIFGFLDHYLESYSEGGLSSLIPGLPSGIPGLPSDKNEESAKEAGAPVTMEDGSVVFIPGTKDIARDDETGLRYIKGMILAYTVVEPDEALQEKLASEVNGTVMGVQNGIAPLVEIRTKASDYKELKALSEKLAAMPEVAFADPEIALDISLETVNTLEQDITPWSKDGSVIEGKGDENHPGGNDWWAEVIRAYSAWAATPELPDPIPVGIIDDGLDMDHPEFAGRVRNVNKIDLNRDDKGEEEKISHGTFVTGIAAASGSNNIGIRGIADRSDIYFMDNQNTIQSVEWVDGTQIIQYTTSPAVISNAYNYMHGKGVRAINHSFGNYILTPEEIRTIDKRQNVDSNIKNALQGYDNNYQAYYDGQRRICEESAKWLLSYMITELINGYEDFLYVQSAGNGSRFDKTPVSADMNLYFCSITEKMFIDQVLQLKEGAALSPEQLQRLEGLKWEDIRGHYMVVGGSISEQVSETEYAPLKNAGAGPTVDICAPAKDVFGINKSTADNDNQYTAQGGTSVAAPMVTGAATLLWSVAPELPAAEIKKILTECTDKKVTDAYRYEHPLLNVGRAVEYTKYYMFVRDVMIPKYGLQKGAQEGRPQNSLENWLEPEGIVTAWIGNMDGRTGDEMVVFRFERDPDSDYSNRRYSLMMDLFTIYNGVVQLLDTVKTDVSLSKKYTMDLDMHVSAAPQGDWTDILIEYDEEETDLYGSDRHIRWVVTSDGETLALQDGDTSGYETKKRIFDMSNENDRADKSRDHFTFLVTDGCRLTWYLDFVFTDRDYVPAGYVSEYAPAAEQAAAGTGQTAAASDEDVIRNVLWTNPANTSGKPRLVRTEDYKDGALSSFDQYAYDENGLLIYKGYFHEGDLSSIVKYEYDDGGSLIRESEILANGKTNYIYSYENDDRGNQIRQYAVPEGGGEITDWNEYEYDEAGNQVKWLGYRKKEFSFYWEYSYDADGNMISCARYDADGTRSRAEEREYDGNGHLLNISGMNDQGDFQVTAAYEWSDDFHTRRSPWFHSGDGSLAGYDIYTFDDFGNMQSFTVQDAGGTVTSEQFYYYD